MDKRTKVKIIITILCLAISAFALYTFVFVANVSKGWRIALTIIAVFWILSAISNLFECLGKKK